MPRAEEQNQQTAQTGSEQPKYEESEVGSTSSPPDTESLQLIQKSVSNIAKETTKNVLEEKLPRYTETLGVFVALFTFVSIEIQIFSRVTSLANAVIFTFLIFLCMVGFLFMLHMTINLKSGTSKESLKSAALPFLGLLIIIGVGYIFISCLIKNDIPLNQQESKEVEEIKEKIIEYNSDIENLKELIQDSKK